METTILNENFDSTKACRLCLNQNDELTSVFEISSLEIQYLIMIKECTEMTISENDQLPKNICLECVRCLNTFYKFRKLVVNSEYCLNNFFNKFNYNLNKDVKIESTTNIKKEIEANEEPACLSIKSNKNLPDLETVSEIKFKIDIVEEELKIDQSNAIITEATSHVSTFEENDSKYGFTSDHNSFDFSTCKICGKNLTSSEALKSHLENCTKQEDAISHTSKQVSSSPQLSKRRIRSNKSKKSYMCEQCGKSFHQSSNLLRHKLIHTGEKPYKCTQCGKSYRQLAHLTTHKIYHKGEKSYKCEICGKSFFTSSCLKTHKRFHTGDKLLKCKLCEKSFTNLSSLTLHEVVHTGETPYSCDACGKFFNQLVNLKKHQKIHTNDKPYICDQCGKSFSDSSYLKYHYRNHTGEKPYKCKVCEKSFVKSSNLKQHEILHTGIKPHKCVHCGNCFSQLNTLKTHEKIHTGEKSYVCEICGKSFIGLSAFIRHKRLHTGEKPYNCKKCQKTFAHLGNLKKHEKIHKDVKSKAGSSKPESQDS